MLIKICIKKFIILNFQHIKLFFTSAQYLLFYGNLCGQPGIIIVSYLLNLLYYFGGASWVSGKDLGEGGLGVRLNDTPSGWLFLPYLLLMPDSPCQGPSMAGTL